MTAHLETRRAYAGAVVLAGVAILTAAAGCLKRDLTETWYLDAAGGVTWVAHERDVHSDAQSPIDRRTEEDEYWLGVQQNRHATLEGLRELGGEKLRTVILRAETPYEVRTEGKFSGLDVLGQRLIAAIGSTGTSIVSHGQDRWEWKMVVRDPSASGASVEPSAGISALFDGLEDLKVVLSSGRFESADGFEISGDGRQAAFRYKEPERAGNEEPAVSLRLAWKSR